MSIVDHHNVTEIEYVLNKQFANVCDCFVDNKLSIHFGENKTKCILSVHKKSYQSLTYDNSRNQYHMIENLGPYLDTNLIGESIAMESLRTIEAKLQFLHTQNDCLTPELHWLLWNSSIQPHFDYA